MLRLLLALALAFAVPSAARAHAALLAASPADGVALARAPSELRLTFDEPVAPIAVALVDAAGNRVALGAPRAVDRDLVVTLPPLADGVWIASWRVTSADSHPVGGALIFAIGPGAAEAIAAAPRPATRDPVGWTAVNVALRFAVTLAVMLAAGGALFDRLVDPLAPALRRRLAAGAAAGAALALLAIGARGALLAAAPPDALLTAAAWRLGLGTNFGASMILAASGLAALAAAWRRRSIPALAAAGAALALLSFALSGHAATAPPAWLAGPAVALHVALAAFWLGAFLPLELALAREPVAVALVAAHRFSRLARNFVLALMLFGGVLLVIQSAGAEAPFASGYLRIAAVKLALVGGLLVLAVGNLRRRTPALDRGEPGAARRLRRAIRFELGTGAAILAVTAALSLTPPPRAAAPAHDHGAATDGIAVALAHARLEATVGIEPGRAGGNRLTIELAGPDGAPLAAKAVTVGFALPVAGIAGLRREAAPLAPGRFAMAGPELAVAGRWSLTLDILVSDFEQITLTTEVDIR